MAVSPILLTASVGVLFLIVLHSSCANLIYRFNAGRGFLILSLLESWAQRIASEPLCSKLGAISNRAPPGELCLQFI
jgi:hypothetical protein